MIEYFNGQSVLPTPLPFSQATRVGNLVFLSGQASVDETGSIIGDTFENEVLRTFRNLETTLRAAGSDIGHIVQVRAYVRDMKNFETFNRLYRSFFPEPYPARTTLTGCLSEVIQFEMDCIAVTSSNGEGEG